MLEGNLKLQIGKFHLTTGDFSLPTTGITVLFGRSGAGKSTLLRALAGLEPKTIGLLKFNETLWQNEDTCLVTEKRNIGFVFQDAALFPHMNVRENLEYALKRSIERTESVESMAMKIGMEHKLNQNVQSLSGGEIQRVAIGRALISKPKILCMDEPLSALDHQAKNEILLLIESLAKDSKIPIIYITHSPDVVERLADHVALIANGRVERVMTLKEALSQMDSPLFDEEGAVSVIEGRIGESDEHGLRNFGNDLINFKLTGLDSRTCEEQHRLRILARNVSIALDTPERMSILNHMRVTIVDISPKKNGRVIVLCKLADSQTLMSEITGYSLATLNLEVGMEVFALVKSVSLLGF
ncbi:molybdenum ABC transporter ATP-binding protein [Halobacteriovorax marinus]|uniref:Molybdenum ABC transporter ATP-binding protein n=1 Tax=Halobacteriovorax marinus TaxID=97084 RepID=A0A1Y5FAV2_9BACT|nr:molybdenum ABC transporter ATP-binding protein [Halobacteriovorax marinus]